MISMKLRQSVYEMNAGCPHSDVWFMTKSPADTPQSFQDILFTVLEPELGFFSISSS